jgi:hypothetical protein
MGVSLNGTDRSRLPELSVEAGGTIIGTSDTREANKGGIGDATGGWACRRATRTATASCTYVLRLVSTAPSTLEGGT